MKNCMCPACVFIARIMEEVLAIYASLTHPKESDQTSEACFPSGACHVDQGKVLAGYTSPICAASQVDFGIFHSSITFLQAGFQRYDAHLEHISSSSSRLQPANVDPPSVKDVLCVTTHDVEGHTGVTRPTLSISGSFCSSSRLPRRLVSGTCKHSGSYLLPPNRASSTSEP